MGAALLAGLLLIIPLVALAIVPVYARATPRLWGFPFFYWYQLAWVLVTAVLTWAAYLVVTRARRNGGSR
jgi:membrane protein implicated in regulation of membrane protease activity